MAIEYLMSGMWLNPVGATRRGMAIALPRKMDVENAATYVASLLGVPVGGWVVGYRWKDHVQYYKEAA
jgi:hypothetical protein